MPDTLIRHLTMLHLIPRYPKVIHTEQLQTFLEARQHTVTLRSIQRDLNKLSCLLPLMGDSARPQGWCWRADATQFTLPALDPQSALTLHMVAQHIKVLLPASTLNHLESWFKAAEEVLASHGNGLAKWSEKVRVLPPGFPRRPPSIDDNVQAVVTEAVLTEKQLSLTYLSNGASQPWTKAIHPLAIIVRDKTIYLLCIFAGYQDVRQLVLHRMQAATVLQDKAIRPSNFDLDSHLAAGEMGIPLNSGMIALEASFAGHLAIHLREAPISDDQCLDTSDEESVLLSATVPDTLELRLWLKSFGDEVAVLRPAALRQEFRQMAENLLNYYADDVDE